MRAILLDSNAESDVRFEVRRMCGRFMRFIRGCTIYQLNVDVDMLNAVKRVLADVSNVSPSSEQRGV